MNEYCLAAGLFEKYCHMILRKAKNVIMFYCTNNKLKVDGTAAAKAPDDVVNIAKKQGFSEIVFYSPRKFKSLILMRFMAIFTGIKNWMRLYRAASPNSVVIIQHPYENILIGNRMIDFCKRRKNLKFIAVIHDLNSLRKEFAFKNPNTLDNRNSVADEVLLKKCDCIICHNDTMKKYLISKGFDGNRLISLGAFDYLHEAILPDTRKLDKSIIVAGNLSESKCGYLYKLIKLKRQYIIHLYGPNYRQTSKQKNVIYHGIFSAEELPSHLHGSFGLVWDGDEVDTCAGNTGEYLRYNNPHKVSLFLSSNVPVIIWKNAALADFVEKNHLGITVETLEEIDERLNHITEIDYSKFLYNVSLVGEKMREGYFTSQAIRSAIKIIEDQSQ